MRRAGRDTFPPVWVLGGNRINDITSLESTEFLFFWSDFILYERIYGLFQEVLHLSLSPDWLDVQGSPLSSLLIC